MLQACMSCLQMLQVPPDTASAASSCLEAGFHQHQCLDNAEIIQNCFLSSLYEQDCNMGPVVLRNTYCWIVIVEKGVGIQ